MLATETARKRGAEGEPRFQMCYGRVAKTEPNGKIGRGASDDTPWKAHTSRVRCRDVGYALKCEDLISLIPGNLAATGDHEAAMRGAPRDSL